MLQIVYSWKFKSGILYVRTIGIGYRCGETGLGQADIITVTEEQVHQGEGATIWARSLFSSGTFWRKLEFKGRIWKRKTFPLRFCLAHFALEYRGWRDKAAGGELIEAIKQYRYETNCSVKEAKDKVMKSRAYRNRDSNPPLEDNK